ncbi:valine--tRNA ligase [Kiloniella laminariae]|uniref:Valine--tRNA ligase n=1 Tax=Kiloniella laminariae TaxID=454162 RepID=A0ABT4LNG1_9PROT|nr:valine--tRNA ligase [Kiloniella laminariae]MCZ4282643.1 valine--tRNA ligase [Kiloniella laminariae]
MLEKTYCPDQVEAKQYARWEKSGAFAADPNSQATPYTIMMPPPNVTGSLHMGHALTFTLQDVLIRYKRMRGHDVLWQPGTDHAGIATQMVVERQLAEKGISRHDLGRDKFLESVWDWKEKSGGTIVKQLRHLGASADWPRERFTMDEGLSAAVRKVFVQLHKEGLIYKDKRLVNWDPKLLTAISDLEVQQNEVNGNLWHFRYPLEGQDGKYIVVATTRPETMLGDSGVAVHPEDERYKDLIGKNVVLPIVGRLIPIVADEYADPETGSGAVKITPAHDFNDFEVGRRCNLEMINVFDKHARINENAPEAYQGMDRFEARKKIVAEFEAQGLLEKIDDHLHTVPHGDRSGVPIEPWLTDQWYVDAATLAKPALEAVETGKTQIVPKQWENTYYEWMRNIQPWCVSRQLWWGHQIPAWYGPDGEIFVEETEEEAQAAALAQLGQAVELTRDPDVLDTWFSSALWPFSTIGWPEQTAELKRYYPGDVLVTGFDIIFFWVARMMMMGMHFMDDVPFKTVYIHALVRDENGQKMSKSKGNVIDPLETIAEYSCDALRFTLSAMAAPGRDIKLASSRVEGYRNFGTKLWNAARFSLMNGAVLDPNFDPLTCKQPVNRWIVGKVAAATAAVDKALDDYRFNDAANALYKFVWNEFCDWYLEFTKPVLASGDSEVEKETKATIAWTLSQILHLLHPIMPYITEELWETIGGEGAGPLISAVWPTFDERYIDAAVEKEMDWVIRLITDIRATRAELNTPPALKAPLLLKDGTEEIKARIASYENVISWLARLSSLDAIEGDLPKGAIQIVLDDATFALPLEGIVDVTQEKARLSKEIEKTLSEIEKIDKKLANEQFISKAPEAVVKEQHSRRDDFQATLNELNAAVERLADL